MRNPLPTLLIACALVGCDSEEGCEEPEHSVEVDAPDEVAVGSSAELRLDPSGSIKGTWVEFSGPATIAWDDGLESGTVPPDKYTYAGHALALDLTCTGVGVVALRVTVAIRDDCQDDRADTLQVQCVAAATEPIPLDCDDPLLADLQEVGDDVLGPDAACDATRTTTDTSDPKHSDGTKTIPQPVDHTGVIAWMAGSGDLVDPVGLYPCGEYPDALTLCASQAPPFPAGQTHVFAMAVGADVPLADPNHHQFAFVFDSDGNAANNYVGQAPYADDFFNDTDLWYVADYNPGYPPQPWSLTVHDRTSGVFVERSWSAARVIIKGSSLVLVVPSSEFAVPSPAIRFTTFSHPGDWGYGGVWSGDLEPPVALGLHSTGI